ncbi:Crp/Fnr family transcriptional regulator [Levilactobacillus hammesii]|uniref:Crp family regulatory protein n=1 Tax=Levilactobacillus hammesii DSM 16381 TaxID=1423753 RepID=A0A0R1UP52_9LACO|nr:Crp/Fnr family transcriptional regulator [Levilactobacillus hammesii]KRL93171.1 Crp family regulatory protein [Levilactobacillus hammesii DSM 16381]
MMNDVFALVDRTPAVQQLLRTCPLHIVNDFQIEHYAVDDFQFLQGTQYDNTYILVEGKVKIYLMSAGGKAVALDIYEQGAFIGEQEALLDKPYSASVINLTPVTVLKIPNDQFKVWLKEDQYFSQKLIYNLSMQIYTLTNRTERYSLHSALDQAISSLIWSTRRNQVITRTNLLNEVDTSSRNLNRILKQLRDLDVIKINKSQIVVTDLPQLITILRNEG